MPKFRRANIGFRSPATSGSSLRWTPDWRWEHTRAPASCSALVDRPTRTQFSTSTQTPIRPVQPGTEPHRARKSVVEGKSVSVRVDLGGRLFFKNQTTYI